MIDEYGHIHEINVNDNSTQWYGNKTAFQVITFIFATSVAVVCFIAIVPFVIKGGLVAKIMVCGGVFLGWWVYTSSITEIMDELNFTYYTGWLYIKSFFFTLLGGVVPGLAYYFFPGACTVIFIVIIIACLGIS